MFSYTSIVVVVVVAAVLGVYVPPTAKVIRRRDLGLKSLPANFKTVEARVRIHDPWLTRQVA